MNNSNDKSTLDGWMNTSENDETTLYDEALRLYEEKRLKEALVLVNIAIEHDASNPEYFATKGLILKDMDRFSESKRAFDEAIKIRSDEGILKSKAEMLYRWANSSNDKQRALEIIDEALEIIPDDERFLYLKGSIYDCMQMPVEARICYLTAEGETEEVERLRAQQEIINSSADTLINITGTQFYFGFDVFTPGLIVDLVAEPENPHDGDAIRVEIEGECVGYVANSDYTLMGSLKGASEITDAKKAEIMFIYLDSFIIAKVIFQ